MARAVLGTAALLALSVILITTLGRLGILVSVILVVMAGVTVMRQDSEREMSSLRRSIDLSATDIAAILDDWDEFLYSRDPIHVRDRELHRPDLRDSRSGISSVARFHAAAGSCERFLRHLPEQMTSLTTVASLTELLYETDQRAVSLERLWDRARQDSARSRHH